jgi:hypothetical protein
MPRGNRLDALFVRPVREGEEGYWEVSLLMDRNLIERWKTRRFRVLPGYVYAANPLAPSLEVLSGTDELLELRLIVGHTLDIKSDLQFVSVPKESPERPPGIWEKEKWTHV